MWDKKYGDRAEKEYGNTTDRSDINGKKDLLERTGGVESMKICRKADGQDLAVSLLCDAFFSRKVHKIIKINF